jgi:preprotein translocase SecF subunit
MISIVKRELNIDFIGKRRIAYAVSLIVIISGIAAFFIRGEKNFGIDFTGGLIMERRFTLPIDTIKIRKALAEVNLAESIIQDSFNSTTFLIRTEKGASDIIDNKFKEKFADKINEDTYILRTDMVGPSIGHELRHKATIAVIISWIGIIGYVAIRYKFNFAVAGVLALVHDVLVTVGAFALTGREINYPVIAALLVIIGYSINDTIVIYDRIRENMKIKKGENAVTIFNLSINQTLSRTLLTTFATLLSVAMLFMIGGEAIKDFAFALLVGMVSGVYSTIFVACSLVITWQRKPA